MFLLQVCLPLTCLNTRVWSQFILHINICLLVAWWKSKIAIYINICLVRYWQLSWSSIKIPNCENGRTGMAFNMPPHFYKFFRTKYYSYTKNRVALIFYDTLGDYISQGRYLVYHKVSYHFFMKFAVFIAFLWFGMGDVKNICSVCCFVSYVTLRLNTCDRLSKYIYCICIYNK